MKVNQQMLSEVAQLKQEILKHTRRKNVNDRLYTNLTELYVDIINAISEVHPEKAPKIHYYANLLEQEIQFYSPMDAYMVGANAKERSDEKQVCWGYQYAIARKISEQKLDFEIQTQFDEIAELLRHKHDLINEFTETYRQVHGALMHNIFDFIKLGQASAAA